MSTQNNCIYNADPSALMRQNSRRKLQTEVESFKNNLCNLQTGIANDIGRLFTKATIPNTTPHTCFGSEYQKLMESEQQANIIRTVKQIVNNALASITAQYAEIAEQMDTLLGGYEGTIAELQAALANKVDKTTTVNGYSLANNVDLAPSDLDLTEIQTTNIDNLF